MESAGAGSGIVRGECASESAKRKQEAGELHRCAVLEPQIVCQRCSLIQAGRQASVEPNGVLEKLESTLSQISSSSSSTFFTR